MQSPNTQQSVSFVEPLNQIVSIVQSLFNGKKTVKTSDMQQIQQLAQNMTTNIIDILLPLASRKDSGAASPQQPTPVSYTHLTLPTILLV